MSYESVPIAPYCSYNGSKHASGISFCSNCGSGRAEIIDLSGSPPRTNALQSVQPPLARVAALHRDVVNTTSQQYSFTFVLISESFYYASQEDHDYDLPTIITRKHIGIFDFVLSYNIY
jgi:hypothetical protein